MKRAPAKLGGDGRPRALIAAEPGGPTAETRRKLKASVIARLAVQGRVSGGQLAAARMLGAIWTELESGVGQADSLVRLQQGGNGGGVRIPDLIRHIIRSELYVMVYRPWCAAVAVADFHLAYTVICYNVGTRQVEKQLGIKHGTAFDRLVRVLDAFENLHSRMFRKMKRS